MYTFLGGRRKVLVHSFISSGDVLEFRICSFSVTSAINELMHFFIIHGEIYLSSLLL